MVLSHGLQLMLNIVTSFTGTTPLMPVNPLVASSWRVFSLEFIEPFACPSSCMAVSCCPITQTEPMMLEWVHCQILCTFVRLFYNGATPRASFTYIHSIRSMVHKGQLNLIHSFLSNFLPTLPNSWSFFLIVLSGGIISRLQPLTAKHDDPH